MTIVTPSSANSWQGCPPLVGTPRRPERQSLGPNVAAVAASMGKPFMPHQHQICNIALELDPETGRLIYRRVVLVMMRQNGKTELILPLTTWRSMAWADQRIVYASHTSAEARRRWEDVHLKRLNESPFKGMYRPRLRFQQEAVLWKNGSAYSPISTTPRTGGTGDSIDQGTIDEAWAHENSGVEQSLLPTMLTREQPQLWIASMVPGPTRLKAIKPEYLRRQMAMGRAAVKAGLDNDICYLEFGAERGLDPGDPATWWSCMPALVHGLIPEAAVRSDFNALPREDFTTEYLSWWPDEADQGWAVIGEGDWELAKDELSFPVGSVALAAAVAPDRSWAAIAAAGLREDGLTHMEITGRPELPDHRPGAGWVLGRLKEIRAHHPTCALVIGDAALAGEADRAGLNPYRLRSGDWLSACGLFYDGVAGADVATRTLRHLGKEMQPQLHDSVRLATKRVAGNGWVWDLRGENGAAATPVVAATSATWALATPRVHVQRREPTASFVARTGVRREPQRDEHGNRVIRFGGAG